MAQKVIIIDFGSQYTQLIARRVRELQIYCEIHPCNNPPKLDESITAVILSGSPYSVTQEDALQFDLETVVNRFPVLGICYGAQYISSSLGGRVESSNKREYGKASLQLANSEEPLFSSMSPESQIWMSHGDTILSVPDNFEIIAQTDSIPIAAFKSTAGAFEKDIYCIQFHPEVSHSLEGKILLKNFLVDIAGCSQDWTAKHFIQTTIDDLKQKIGTDKVVMGLSGGVDSTVAATLLHRAIGDQLICIFVDNGLLRKNEFPEVLESYQGMGLNIIGVDATDDFLNELEGVSDPEKKRKIIGRVFIEVFEREANKLDNIKWLGQGTIYPDVIESVSVHGPSATIKSHHNVGGLPERLALGIVEPLRALFKDEVRVIGTEMGITQEIIGRHPFPGPGLAIRILGPISRDKIVLTQEADAIYINQLKKDGLYDKVWQAGAILLPVQSVGVMGDERTYEYTLALRCVNSVDGMTADWSKLPHEFLETVSTEIINHVKGINRVVYDISTKPPATIEWE